MFLEKGFPPDWSTHRRLIWESMLSGGSLPWQTFTGNPLQFRAPKAHTLKSTSVSFTPKQEGSGDPSPTNVRPISGWNSIDVTRAGENLWDEEWELGYYSPTTGAPTPSNNCIRSKNYVPICPNTKYCFVFPQASGVNAKLCFYDINKNFLSFVGSIVGAMSNPVPSNAYYLRFFMADPYGTTYNHDISINYPSTDTEYHPTKGISTTTLSFGQTVYGGTAEVAEDGSGSGEDGMTLSQFDGTEVYSQYGQYVVCNRFEPVGKGDYWSMLCSHVNARTGSVNWSNAYKNHMQFRIADFGASDVDEFKALLAAWNAEGKPLQVSYPLATSVPFTPTVAGQPTAVQGINTVWSDANGDVTAQARATAVNNA